MFIQFGQALGDYLYDVFVAKFDFWLAFGLVAQLLFTARFLVQWISSERAGRSVIPIAFWFFSMGGGLMTLVYGIAKREPVIIIGQSLATIRGGRAPAPAVPPDRSPSSDRRRVRRRHPARGRRPSRCASGCAGGRAARRDEAR